MKSEVTLPSGPIFPGNGLLIEAPARLHMGFLDMSGSLGRRFGSIGLGINEIVTRLLIQPADTLRVTGPEADRALRMAETLSAAVGKPLPGHVNIIATIPGHAGLGSGTQLALAVAAGLARLHGLELSPTELAGLLGRGARSGIGIAVFEQGGLVVDAGRGSASKVPPVVARLAVPEDWRLIILLDRDRQGLHGHPEKAAFSRLPPFPASEAARLCHLVLMRGLPGLVEGDIEAFGSVITELQRTVGDHFAPAQGGRFTSPRVQAALEFLASEGAVGIGQSSWGPTGFCLVDKPALAESLRSAAMNRFAEWPDLEILVSTPRMHGAAIQLAPAA